MKSALETAVEEKQIEIARKLIKRNLTNEEIAEDTGLTLEQIEQLRNETKKN
jgi:DNA-binding Xre family transcriptional regulator